MAIPATPCHTAVSFIAPFFHKNPPETGMGMTNDERMTADRCNFMGMLRIHAVTDYNIIEVL